MSLHEDEGAMTQDEGIVYVLTNPAMKGLVKIGMTTAADVATRISQLYSTGVPVPFECVKAVKVRDSKAVERALHYAFAPQRLNPNREFFEIESSQVTVLLDQLKTEDVTPETQDASDESTGIEDIAAREKRRPPIEFRKLGIQPGEEIVFERTGDVAVVSSQNWDKGFNWVEYKGETYALSALTGSLSGQDRHLSPLYAHWTYHGDRLRELHDSYWLRQKENIDE